MELALSALTNTIYLANIKKDGTMSLNNRKEVTNNVFDIIYTWFECTGYHENIIRDLITGEVNGALFYSDDVEKIKKIEKILFDGDRSLTEVK